MVRGNRPLLLGHRGARAVRSIPENTFESFDRALADGCDGFEFDVRLTADGVAVVCHDPRFQGLEIAKVRAQQVPELPLLGDVLSQYQERAFLDIELKVGSLETITLQVLQNYPLKRGFVVSSFLPEVLISLREKDQHVPLGLICETQNELRRWKELPVEYVIPHYKLMTQALVREFKSAGKKTMVWTVNDSKAAMQLRDLPVDGIISDSTELLCRTLM